MSELDLEKVKRILLVKLGAVGDCVHTLYALGALRARFPQSVIGWAVEDKAYQVVSWHPHLDRVHILTKNEGWARWIKDANDISGFGYDVAIDFSNLFKSGFVTCRSGVKTRIGFDKYREGNFLFTNKRIKSSNQHMIERYLELLEPFGISSLSETVAIYVPQKAKEYIDKFFNEKLPAGTPVVVLNPHATWLNKLYSIDGYAYIADKLISSGHRVVLAWGGEKELAVVKRLAAMMKNKVILAPPTDLKQLYYLMSKCDIYLGNDTGPMHMAAASGIGVVGIFGPTNPDRVGPRTDKKRVCHTGDECKDWPCEKRKCKDPICINRIRPDKIVDAVLSLIKESG